MTCFQLSLSYTQHSLPPLSSPSSLFLLSLPPLSSPSSLSLSVQFASSSVSPFLLSLFKLPLILLVSQIPPTGSGSAWNMNRKLANQLLSEIETHHTREDITDDINSDVSVMVKR